MDHRVSPGKEKDKLPEPVPEVDPTHRQNMSVRSSGLTHNCESGFLRRCVRLLVITGLDPVICGIGGRGMAGSGPAMTILHTP